MIFGIEHGFDIVLVARQLNTLDINGNKHTRSATCHLSLSETWMSALGLREPSQTQLFNFLGGFLQYNPRSSPFFNSYKLCKICSTTSIADCLIRPIDRLSQHALLILPLVCKQRHTEPWPTILEQYVSLQVFHLDFQPQIARATIHKSQLSMGRKLLPTRDLAQGSSNFEAGNIPSRSCDDVFSPKLGHELSSAAHVASLHRLTPAVEFLELRVLFIFGQMVKLFQDAGQSLVEELVSGRPQDRTQGLQKVLELQ